MSSFPRHPGVVEMNISPVPGFAMDAFDHAVRLPLNGNQIEIACVPGENGKTALALIVSDIETESGPANVMVGADVPQTYFE